MDQRTDGSSDEFFRSDRNVGTGLQKVPVRCNQRNAEVGSCDDELGVVSGEIVRRSHLQHIISRWLNLALAKHCLSNMPCVVCLCQREHLCPD